MITLFDCAFSPFARKVRLVLEAKGLAFEAVDGLRKSHHARLAAVNPRGEVPVLVDGGTVIVNSSHIVQYLEDAYPANPVLPPDPAGRARVRHWERVADTRVDAIVVDLSLWGWAKRDDTPPAGLLDAARADLEAIYASLEAELADGREYLAGTPGLADYAMFPHLSAARPLRVGPDPARFPQTAAWMKRLAHHPLCTADIARLKAWFAALDGDFERERIFWRGDRIEWLLSAGFHRWLFAEIEAGRAIFPPTGRPA
jgi:glutathione S-transferase